MKLRTKLLCLTLSMLMVLSVCGALMVSAAEKNFRVDSGDGSGVMYYGGTYNSCNIHTLTFNTDDYAIIPFSAYSGGTYTLNGQYSQAVNWGYEPVGIINGDFFALANGYLNDYIVSNGEVVIGDTGTHGSMTCIMPDGTIKTVATSQLKFATYFNGMEVPGGISYINRRPNRTTADGWSDALYYYDYTAASDKCPLAGVAVICKKLNGTVLAIGGTMDAKVVSVEERSNANGITLAKDEFLLYVRSSSPLAATLKALNPGDSVTVNASETIAASAETTSNATSILANIGYLVKNGENFAATDEFNKIDPHGNKYKAAWTAFGTKDDGSWMFFISEASNQLTQPQVAEYMISQGCTTVIRLDGGGSVAMYLSNTGSGSAGYAYNQTRNVPDCLMVVKRTSKALQPSDDVKSTLEDLIAKAQDSTDENAKAALEYAQSIVNNEKSVSGDYIKAMMRLLDALNNKGTLGNMLAVAAGANFADYSEYALTRLREAYIAASEVFGNPDATADEVAIATALLVKWVNAKGPYTTSETTYPKMSTTDNFKLLKFNTKIGEGDITLFTPGQSVAQDSANLKWAGAILLRKNAHGSYVVEKVINCAAVGSDTYPTDQLGFTVVPDDCLVLGAHGSVNNPAVREAAKVGSIFTTHGIDIEKQTIGVGAYFNFVTATGDGHTLDWKVTKEPTCDEKGSEILTCTICGETSGSARVIDELDHVFKDRACLLCGAPQATNVALGKDYGIGYGTNNATYNANLTDGNASTGLSYQPDEWFGFVASNTQNNVGTVTIDLGDNYIIDYASVHTYFGKTGDGVVTPASMKIEVSSDGIAYTALGEEVKYDNPAQAPGFTTEWVNFAGAEPVTGRYVKLTVVIQGAFAFLNEIEVYGIPTEPIPSENVALGKEVTVKKAEAIPQYSNADLTDGKIATTMGYGNPADEWFSFYYNADYANQVNIELVDNLRFGNFVVDLEDYYELDSFRIHYNKDFVPTTTKIYVSTNGVGYTKVLEASTTAASGFVNGYGCWIDFPLKETVTAQYVKVEFVFSGMFAMLDEFEAYGIPAEYTPREPAGEIVIDGKLDDTGYEDAVWTDHGIWQNAGVPEPADLTGKFTTRMDDEYIAIAVQINNTVAPNILDDYAAKVAGGLTANGAQTSTYVQTGATTFRVWLRGDAVTRYLIDVQYLGEDLGWVATRAIFPAGSTLTWDDLEVLVAADYTDGVLTAEIAFPKDLFGINETVAAFVTYSDNKLEDGVNASGYQCFHIGSTDTPTNASGRIVDFSGNVHTAPYIYYTKEAIAVTEIREPRVPTGTVTIDGVLDDDTYEDKTAAPWNEHFLWQNKGAPQPADMSGKFTARTDGENISVAIEIQGAVEPNILPSYLEKIANAGKLSANGAQADLYVQTGATTFRIWLRGDANERYLIDVQYLGENIGWVATRAIFPTGSSLTWDDLKVIVAADYTDGVLTMEVTFPKEQFGVTGNFAMFITYSDNLTDETYTTPTYQCLHLCSVDTEVNADGLISNYSGNVTHPYVIFTEERAAVEEINFSDALNMASLNYTNLGAAVVRADLALDEKLYTPESWKPFAEALAEAMDALNARARAITTQDEIDELAKKLLAAYEALEYADADYTAVDNAIDAANELDENNYTEETWKALQDAIAAVDRTLKADKQADVDAMAKAIEDAINALELKPADYSELDGLLAIVEKMVPKNYTEESWNTLQAAIDAVVRDLKIDKQADVDAMTKAIYNALLGLVEADPDDNTTSDETTSDVTTSDETTSDETTSDETTSDETTSDETTSDETTSDETTSDETSSEETSSEETSSEETSSEDNTSSEGSTSSEGNTSSEASTSTPSTPSSSDSPITGDDNSIVIFALLAVLSLAGAIVAIRVRH